MASGFTFSNTSYGWPLSVDLDDIYIRSDAFQEGNLWTWGYNTQGQLGDNTTAHKSSPIQTIAGGTNWKQLSAGGVASCGIKSDGTLWTWGYNIFGVLGNNAAGNQSSPVQTICSGTNWKQVHCGSYFTTAAIKTDGTLWIWGYNSQGQLGNNSVADKSSPVQTICSGTNWKQVACGSEHTLAIKTDGTLWTWGYNNAGQLGDSTTTKRSSPVQTIAGGTNWKQVSGSENFTLAIKTDSTLWVWGQSANGKLGTNALTDQSSPVQTICSGTNWKQVGAGVHHSAAIKTDGTLWAWGVGGRTGDNTYVSRSSPVQTIAGGTNWKYLSVGGYFNAAIKTDGTLWTWGENTAGHLGDNTITNRSSPVQIVATGTNWKHVSAGDNFALALTID